MIVLPGKAKHAGSLPYSEWLDYCAIAFVVSAKTAKTNLAGVLARLRQVGAEEAAAKHGVLRQVSTAFTVVPGSTIQAPAAPEFVLHAACERARARRNSSAPSHAVGARMHGANARCVL